MARKGLNYYYLRDSYNGILPKPSIEKPRVFISHQKKDSDVAGKIADYLLDAGIDVYFDQYDSSINRSDPKSVVNAIRTGIENSSHMIVLFSPNTFGSMWVPWEIGYAYRSQIALNVLKLKGVSKYELPDYLKVVKIILDIYDLNVLISNVTRVTGDQLITEGRISNYTNTLHPLNSYMDSFAGTL